MSKRILFFLLASTLVFTACGSTNGRAEKAGKALAETACFSFDSESSEEESTSSLADYAEMVAKDYGFKDSSDLQAFVDEIEGTEAMNKMALAAREHLEATCGDSLEALGISSADFAESLTVQ